jgi:hypothetical protein
LRAWATVLFVYRHQLICIHALECHPEQSATLACELSRSRVVEGEGVPDFV